jgi:XRE family transcriptional regulator, regulator of sulfur utilization
VPTNYYRDEKFLKKFGANLKKVRKETGVSQEELANDLGFSQAYIAKVESGIVNLSISHIVAIAKRLKVSVCSLVEL